MLTFSYNVTLSFPSFSWLAFGFNVEIRFNPTNNVYPANEKESNVEVTDMVISQIFPNTIKGDTPPNISIIDRHIAIHRGWTISLIYFVYFTPFNSPFKPSNSRLSIIHLKMERILSRTDTSLLSIVVLIISTLGYSVVLYVFFCLPSFI